MSDNPETHPTTKTSDVQMLDGPPPANENVQRFLKMIEDIQLGYQQLRQKLEGDELYNALVGGLSCHPNFISLVRHMVRETMAEIIAEQSHDHGVETLLDDPNVSHYIAELSETRLPASLLRVSLTSSYHPGNPNGVDAYVNEVPDSTCDADDKWRQVKLSTLAENAARDALAAAAIPPGSYWWCALTVVTKTPLNEDSRVVPAEESVDGSGQA